ncbi:hypothetical protein DUI87_07942 [Hirundo rustica rustica]|uniref:Uncharacterized protein n=1 Tax=Hirundo rustica rustica TaxID=333673 RepID=A0A3M0KR61_HIRRU|nr:hypothetical protein DUI87_07942 [Hirundo rustica rustica]
MTSLLLLATPFLIQARMPLALLATWAHCWLMFSCWHQHPQVPFLLGTAQPHLPQPVTLQGVIVAKVQDSALGLIKPHPIGLCPSVQPFQVSLQSHPTFQQIDTHSQLSVICKFANQRFNTHIHVINKNIEQHWPQHRPLRDTTSDWPQLDAAPFTATLWAQPSSQFLTQQRVLLSKPWAASLSRSNAVGDSVKSLAEVQIDNIHSPSCIHQVGHLVIKGDQVGQTRPAPPKPMLAGSDTLAILQLLHDETQYKLFHYLASYPMGKVCFELVHSGEQDLSEDLVDAELLEEY